MYVVKHVSGILESDSIWFINMFMLKKKSAVGAKVVYDLKEELQAYTDSAPSLIRVYAVSSVAQSFTGVLGMFSARGTAIEMISPDNRRFRIENKYPKDWLGYYYAPFALEDFPDWDGCTNPQLIDLVKNYNDYMRSVVFNQPKDWGYLEKFYRLFVLKCREIGITTSTPSAKVNTEIYYNDIYERDIAAKTFLDPISGRTTYLTPAEIAELRDNGPVYERNYPMLARKLSFWKTRSGCAQFSERLFGFDKDHAASAQFYAYSSERYKDSKQKRAEARDNQERNALYAASIKRIFKDEDQPDNFYIPAVFKLESRPEVVEPSEGMLLDTYEEYSWFTQHTGAVLLETTEGQSYVETEEDLFNCDYKRCPECGSVYKITEGCYDTEYDIYHEYPVQFVNYEDALSAADEKQLAKLMGKRRYTDGD